MRDEFLSTSKHLANSKVAIENASCSKKEMETQYQKYDDNVF